ncbi:MAG: SIMPL domain-containing protein [Verrucomicrobiales bacterium]
MLEGWAISRVDAVAHGFGGHLVKGLASTDYTGEGFLNDRNAFRGLYRRAVTVGCPHLYGAGTVQAYAAQLLRETRKLDPSPNGPFSFFPSSLLSEDPWGIEEEANARIYYYAKFSHANPNAMICPLGTRIDPSAAPAFKHIALAGARLALVAPLGSDGVVEIESATAGFEGVELTGHLASHAGGASLFGAAAQAESPEVGAKVIELLDAADSRGFVAASGIGVGVSELSGLRNRQIADAVADAIRQRAEEVVLARTQLLELLADDAKAGKKGAGEKAEETFAYEIAIPPEAPLAPGSTPSFIAEVFGPDGPTFGGVSVAVDPGNPARVSVVVADGVVGDVVLYASYESANAGLIFAEPAVVASPAPAGATLASIALVPDTLTLDVGSETAPVLFANYSNGMSLRRWIAPGDFTVVSSNPAAVDVSADKMRWKALADGLSNVTVTYAGLQARAAITVKAAHPPLDFSAWKAQFFDAAELADPAVAGDFADPDGDALSTYFEYLTGGHPRFTDASGPVQVIEADLGGTVRPVVAIRLSAQLSGETVRVQSSGELGGWEDVFAFSGSGSPGEGHPAVLAITDDGPFFTVILDPAEIGAAFFRLASGAGG